MALAVTFAGTASAATINELIKTGSGAGGENTLVDDNREYLIDREGGTKGQIDVGDSIRGLASWSKLNGNPLGFGTSNSELTSVFQIMVTNKLETSPGSDEFIFEFGPDPTFSEAATLGLEGQAMMVFYEDRGSGDFAALDFDDPTSPFSEPYIDDGTTMTPPSTEDVSNNAAKATEETFISTANDGQYYWAAGFTGDMVDGKATAADGEGWRNQDTGPDNVLEFFGVDSGTDLDSHNFSLNRIVAGGGLGESLGLVKRESFIDPSFDVDFNGSSTLEGVRNELTAFEISSQSTLTFAVIPLPATAWMGLAMLGGLGAIRTLRRKHAMA